MIPEAVNFNKLKVWIQINNLPIGFMNDDVARGFAEVVGRLCKGSQKGAELVKSKFARYQMVIDVFEPIIIGCYLEMRNEGVEWSKFKYEKLPSLCYKCEAISHVDDKCPVEDEEGSQVTESGP
ncbi:hypothetical protein QQ045_005622 [Rhodiola kirilowii]